MARGRALFQPIAKRRPTTFAPQRKPLHRTAGPVGINETLAGGTNFLPAIPRQ